MSRYFDLVTQSNNLNIKLCYLRYTVHVQEHTKKKNLLIVFTFFFLFFPISIKFVVVFTIRNLIIG